MIILITLTSGTDIPDYERAYSLLQNTVPIYYDAILLKEEIKMAITEKENCLNKLIELRNSQINNLIGSLKELASTDYEKSALISRYAKLRDTTLNPNSTNQIKEILIDIYGLDQDNFMYRNKVSTKASILDDVYEKTKNPFIGALKEYRDYDNTIKGLTDILNFSSETDYVNIDNHPIIAVKPIWGNTVSSRFTTKNPNIQGLKRELRVINTARKGYKILSIDIRQQELVIYFSTIANEPYLLKTFAKYDKDYYMTITRFCQARDILLKNLSLYCEEKNYNKDLILKLNETALLKRVNYNNLDDNTPTLESKNGRYNLKYSYNNKVLSELAYKSLVLSEALQSGNKDVINKIMAKLYSWNDVVFSKSVKDLSKLDIDDSKRAGYKLATIMSMYGASIDAIKEKVDGEIVESLFDMIKSSDEYKAYDKYARYNIKQGNLIVKSAFGTQSIIENRNFGYAHRCFFNRPTQTTGADITSFILTKFDDFRKAKGLPEEDIAISYSLYDEVNIHIKDDLLYLVPEIMNIMEFKINDWIPMYAEYAIGDYNNG